MATRRSVWSDEAVQELAAKFVAVADEVSRLQREQEADCKFFRGFCEQGHYGGRTKPSNTRQGIYAVTARGAFLASVNTRDADEVVKMLRKALAKFEALPRAERSGTAPAIDPGAIARFERHFPTDGLVLRAYTRDVARTKETPGWRGSAWNQDHAWFRRDEVLSFVPQAELGARGEMPAALLQRFVRAHFTDNVRGQTFSHLPENVAAATLTATCDALDGDYQLLLLEGSVRIERHGTWATRGYGPPSEQDLGYACKLLGAARFDRARGVFTAFQLLAIGERHGATEFNGRQDDFGPAPMGIAFELAPADAPRVAPSLQWVYGWK